MPASSETPKNGKPRQTFAVMTAAIAVAGCPSQAIGSRWSPTPWRVTLMRPHSALNIQCQVSAVMTVGITHGTSSTARRNDRASSARWSASAMSMPRTTFTATEARVKTTLFHTTLWKIGSRARGAEVGEDIGRHDLGGGGRQGPRPPRRTCVLRRLEDGPVRLVLLPVRVRAQPLERGHHLARRGVHVFLRLVARHDEADQVPGQLGLLAGVEHGPREEEHVVVPPGGPRGLDRHDRVLQDRPVLLLEDVVDGRAVEGERDLAG